ncbi:MAG: DHH family phosphoesterase [Chloroflexota bacterium]|nr:DHH family phosphoesterase [Chloroflexota bacterium]
MTAPIIVTGHRNPDTDAIASAVGYAWTLGAAAGLPDSYRAIALGAVNAQTQFALDRFGMTAPPVIAHADAVAQPRTFILVDHNEQEQSLPGLEGTDVIEILDHHRLATVTTALPIRVQIEPIGSCSTLVAERAASLGLILPPGIAGLLLCGILSDTLIFKSPTTTAREQNAARKLAVLANLVDADADPAAIDAAIVELGNPLLASSGGIGDRPADAIAANDLKFFEEKGFKFGIAQIEVTSLRDLPGRLDEIKGALLTLAVENTLGLAIIMVTDVVQGSSRLIVTGDPHAVAALPYARLDDGTLDAPGMMSRKKQLLPTVLEYVTGMA